MRKIFISYRRHGDTTAGYAGQIHNFLESKLGPETVFRDLDSLAPAIKWRDKIEEALAECDLAIVLVGPHFNPPGKDGRPRLDDPKDVLRLEIARALALDHVTVLPVLFDVDEWPPLDPFPADIAELGERQFAQWYVAESERFELERLWEGIKRADRRTKTLWPPADTVPPPSDMTVEVVEGAEIDGYRLDAKTAESPRAVVYRATQLNMDRTVALKFMSEQAASDAAARALFIRVGKLVGALAHENVIPLYDIGEVAGRPYLVSHFVAGRSLEQIVSDNGPKRPVQALQVLTALASALDAAHKLGLAHEGARPSDILVEESTDRVFLSSFRDTSPGSGDEELAAHITGLADVLSTLLVGADRAAAPSPEEVPASLRSLIAEATDPAGVRRFGSAEAFARAAYEAYERTAEPIEMVLTGPTLTGVPLSESLSAQVLDLLEEALPNIANDADRFAVERVRRRLREPMHLAIAGPAEIGQAAIVNALLGTRIAPATRELRNVFWWYRFGHFPRVDLVLHDGDRVPAELAKDGLAIDDLGTSPAEIAWVDARLPLDLLRSLTVVQLPPARGQDDTSSKNFTDNYVKALRRADAILLAIDQTEVDPSLQDTLAAQFGELADASGMSALNAVAVLGSRTRASAASGLSGETLHKLAEALGPRVAAVVPLAPQLAEAAITSPITSAEVRSLTTLGELDPDLRDHVQEAFISGHSLAGAPLSRDDFDRVYRKIGDLGVRAGVELAQYSDLTPAEVTHHLRQISGIDELAREVSGLQLRADVLKASKSLGALEKLSVRSGLSFLGDEIERLQFRGPGMELIRTVDAFARCVSGQVKLRPDKLAELQRVLTGRTLQDRLGVSADASHAETTRAAAEQLRAWKAFEGLASPKERRVAGAVVGHYEAVLTELATNTKEGVA